MSLLRSCFLQIVTSADGEESNFSTEAEMELLPRSAVLRYRHGEGDVVLRIEERAVALERGGDYLLRLNFSEGEALPGVIGLAGAEGSVETKTHRLGCSVGKDSVLLSMRYTLRFDRGDQEMKLRLFARGKNHPEEK